MLTAVWHYRSFVLGMVRREFRARYVNSVLGSAWALIAPLSTIVIYTVIFGRIMHARLDGAADRFAYGIFLCAGVTTWGMFTEVVQRSISIFIEQANLLKKTSFPRATLPLIVLLSAAVNFGIVFGLLLLFLAVTGVSRGGHWWRFFRFWSCSSRSHWAWASRSVSSTSSSATSRTQSRSCCSSGSG